MWEALKDLGKTNFTVYLYFAANAEDYKFALSPAHIEKETGIKTSATQEAVRKMIDKGYLYHKGNNHYIFYDRPIKI